MARQHWAYGAYGLGSVVFLSLAIARGSLWLGVGSGLFLLGTLLFVVPHLTRRRRGRHERSRVRWRTPTRGGAAR